MDTQFSASRTLGQTLIFVNILCILHDNFIMATTLVNNKSCQEAQLSCHALNGCRQAYTNFLVQCNRLILGYETEQCPESCKHALASLFAAEDGAGGTFVNCDCQNGHMCMERKRRVEICQTEVMKLLHTIDCEKTPVSCNLARWLCEAETSCLTALRYYYSRCSRTFTGERRCTSKCKNSLHILSRQPRANKLSTCVCDGSEDFDCLKWKKNTERFCFRSNHVSHHGVSNKTDRGQIKYSDNNIKDLLRKQRRRRKRKFHRGKAFRRHGRRGRRKWRRGRRKQKKT